jgi:hypothetical protein
MIATRAPITSKTSGDGCSLWRGNGGRAGAGRYVFAPESRLFAALALAKASEQICLCQSHGITLAPERAPGSCQPYRPERKKIAKLIYESA